MSGIDNTEIELSYTKKTPSSLIYQSFQKFPNINYKKQEIILGGNTSGKTSLANPCALFKIF